MAQHTSLKASSLSKAQRSVLKRYERIQHLKKTGIWKEGQPVYGLPKIKVMKIKSGKSKGPAKGPGDAAAKETTTTPPQK